MANSDAPQGLKALRTLSGTPYSGAANKYHVAAGDADAIYLGGLVKLTGTADANGVAGVTGNVASGDKVVGVMVGVADALASDSVYRAASTERYVLVADNPDLLFEVQEDSDGAALTADEIGTVADLTGFTAGDAATGLSAIEVDSSTATAAGDGSEDVMIVGLSQREDNELGDNAKVLVRLNNHAFAGTSTGA